MSKPIAEQIADYCIDWDGKPMSNAEEPRIVPNCGQLRALIAALAEASRERDEALAAINSRPPDWEMVWVQNLCAHAEGRFYPTDEWRRIFVVELRKLVERAAAAETQVSLLKARVAKLEARLEIDHWFRLGDGDELTREEVPPEERDSIPDGIAARDETIKILETQLLTLTAIMSESPPAGQEPAIRKLTRPIIGIENRTAQEVFDIMVDRIKAALVPAVAGEAVKPIAYVAKLYSSARVHLCWTITEAQSLGHNEDVLEYCRPLYTVPSSERERGLREMLGEAESLLLELTGHDLERDALLRRIRAALHPEAQNHDR